jgi:hypothetical protein
MSVLRRLDGDGTYNQTQPLEQLAGFPFLVPVFNSISVYYLLPINILLTPDTHPQATINFTLLAPL